MCHHYTFFICAIILLLFAGCSEQVPKRATVRVIELPGEGMVPDAEVDASGTVHLAYIDDSDVYYVTSMDEGETFSEPIRINSEAGFAFGGRYAGPDVAIGGNGTVHVVWDNAAHQQRRPDEEWGVMYARLLPGETAFEPDRNLSHRVSENFSVAADGHGGVSIVWMADSLYISTSIDGGDTFLPAEAMPVDQCECCGSRALYDDEGEFFVLYRDKADNIRDMHLASLRKGADGFTQTKLSQTPWPIEACPMTGSFLVQHNESLVAAWETEGRVSIGEVAIDDKSLLYDEIVVTDKGKYPVALRSGDGRTLAAWKAGSNLVWQWVGADGVLVGQPDSLQVSSPHRPGGVVAMSGNMLLFP